jgi:Tyrosine phosphatase family
MTLNVFCASRNRIGGQYAFSIYDTPVFMGLITDGTPAIAMLGTPRWAMEGALEQLDSTYGGIESYLLGLGGMDPATLESLRGRLLR